MLTAQCTVCGAPVLGHPDDDVTCSTCEQANFAGDLLRYPPQGTRSWWLAARGELAPCLRPRPVPDGLRVLSRAHGWRWRADDAREEGSHGH